MGKPTHLVCFDLDGTLVDSGRRISPPAVLYTYIDLLEQAGAATVLATGRTLQQALDVLHGCSVNLVPRFIIARDYKIHSASDSGNWDRLEPWYTIAKEKHCEARSTYDAVQAELRRYALEHTTASFLDLDEGLGDFLCKSYQEVLRLCQFVEHVRTRAPLLQYYCNNLHIRLGLTTFNKGTALAALGSSLGIVPYNVFAAGDNHNDLPMLNGDPARRIACPGNAVPIVKHTVMRKQGFVATSPAGTGLSEALHYFFFRG